MTREIEIGIIRAGLRQLLTLSDEALRAIEPWLERWMIADTLEHYPRLDPEYEAARELITKAAHRMRERKAL